VRCPWFADVEVPLEMSRGGGDYRDAFREGGGTYAEQELGVWPATSSNAFKPSFVEVNGIL